jgi:hypothetical protein|tara:strand:+ start:29000 stop:29563 length:564 start_codon:yes stop_codon:yes gene_type:complete
MPLQKINSDGKFTYFPGVTIISGITRDELSFWDNIYSTLLSNSLIKENFSLLPTESYHITSINLFTKSSFVNTPWSNILKSNPHLFSFPPPAQFVLKALITQGDVELDMTLACQYKHISEKRLDSMTQDINEQLNNIFTKFISWNGIELNILPPNEKEGCTTAIFKQKRHDKAADGDISDKLGCTVS